MILLLGGTSEAAVIARTLFEEGFQVLLSTATLIPPRGGLYAGILRRSGELDFSGLVDLLRAQGIRAVVDATHPYAEAISANACAACKRIGIPYVAYERPNVATDFAGIHWASDHVHAAALACSSGRHILLTTGTRNLAPYVAAAGLHGIKLVVRVLNQPASFETCCRLGLNAEDIVCANGPFSMEDNINLITRYHIDVLVTKDSGEAGGALTKIIAAKNTGCRVVVIERPPRPQKGHRSISDLMDAIRLCVGSNPERRL